LGDSKPREFLAYRKAENTQENSLRRALSRRKNRRETPDDSFIGNSKKTRFTKEERWN